MSITPEQLQATANLARLKLNSGEIDEVTQRITAILDLVDQMQAVDTAQVAPMAHPLDAEQVLRPDTVIEADDKVAARDQLLNNAPQAEDGLFLVPKVIE